MPKFLETKLKKEYGEKSTVPFKVMNKIGAMRGNKETAKGKAMQEKHDNKEAKAAKAKTPKSVMRELRVEIHRGPKPKRAVTGYTVHHHMMPRSTGDSGAFMEHETHTQPFSADEHEAMLDHVQEHLGGADEEDEQG